MEELGSQFSDNICTETHPIRVIDHSLDAHFDGLQQCGFEVRTKQDRKGEKGKRVGNSGKMTDWRRGREGGRTKVRLTSVL